MSSPTTTQPRILTPEQHAQRTAEAHAITHENLWWRKLFHLRAKIARRQATQQSAPYHHERGAKDAAL